MCPMCNGPLAYGRAAVMVYRDGAFKVGVLIIFDKDKKPVTLKHTTMRKPESLQPGDEIRIVSTARKIALKELQPAIDRLNGWGFKTTLGKNLFSENHQLSGTDAERAADFQDALNDSQVKAIVCARGGYGTVRILDRLDFSTFEQQPKWIAGYSDVTAMHNHIHRHFGICTLHSTMPINFSKNTSLALDSLRNALTGKNLNYTIPEHPHNRFGEAEGIITGGNLSMLYSLMGSPSQVNTDGKILFIEDLDEYLYHVDRMMVNLKRSGLLSNLKGLILGGLTDMNDNTIPFGKTAIEIVSEHVAEFDYPVCFGFPAGHLDDNRTLVLGANAKLAVGNTGASFMQ